jgi:tetratricopeptide (TPR) repeat protein
MDAPMTLDVVLFEQSLAAAERAAQRSNQPELLSHLEAAVEHYTGDLLPNCYDDWLVPERERLRERFLGLLAQLSDTLEQAREYPAAIRHANRLLRTDPLHEATYRRLMQLHLLNNDRVAALRSYHTCAATLQRELGVEPSPLTQEIYAHLLHLEAAPVQAERQSKQAHDALVGRQREWQRLMVVWKQAWQGQPHFVLIGGDAGIGKTRLVDELAHWVRQQGYAAATARAYAAEGGLAFDPIVEWLRSESLQGRMQRLEDIWLLEVARLVPEVRAQRSHLPNPHPLTEGWQRRHFFEALARAFLSTAEPILLVLEDLQWCDRETLDWLHYLLRFDPHSRLLVVGTARLDEIDAGHPLHTLLRELRQSSQVTEMELSPLDPAETVQLAQQIANRGFDPLHATTICRVTEGNPLLIQEMVQAEILSGPGFQNEQLAAGQRLPPSKMESVIQARLTRLSTGARHLAALAATIGRSFSFALLRQVSDTDENQLVAALDELWQRHIVREHGSDSYDFSHDKIREVAYATISPIWRRRFHAQIAQALEHLHSTELHTVIARIAAHYRQAGDTAKAAAYYFRAASEMHFGFAYDETLSHLEHGLAMVRGQPRSDENIALEIAMLVARGRALTARDGWGSPGVIEAFESAHRLCLETNNLTQLVRVQDYLQIAYGDSGNYSQALVVAESSLALAKRLKNKTEIEGAQGSLGFLLWCMGNFSLAREHLEQAASQARIASGATNAHQSLLYPGAFPYALVLWLLGYPDSAQRYLEDVLAAQESTVGPFDCMTGYEFCVIFHHWCGEFREMQAYAQKMLALTEKYEYTTYQWVAEIYTAAAAAALGEPHAGSTQLRQKIEAVKAQGTRMHIPYCLYLLAEVCTQAGDVGEAFAVLDEALAMVAETKERLWEAGTHLLYGNLLAAQRDLMEAESSYHRALTVARDQQAKSLELRVAINLCRLWQVQGKGSAAYGLLAPIYGWFTEGFETSDLQEAQALLAKLNA